MERSLVGEDFGARDVTAGEIASNFGAKAIGGNWDTLHNIKPPSGMEQFIGLAAMDFKSEEENTLLTEEDCLNQRTRVPGWRVETQGECVVITQNFRLKDTDAAATALARLEELATTAGYPMHDTKLSAEQLDVTLCTPSKGGVTMNDFILAGKLNTVDLKDLQPIKKRPVWV
jgi:4a-hydroxytetrahydrobiopterin dehydratase